MGLTPEKLAERMLEEGEKTVAFFRPLTSQQIEQTLYTDGACWSVRQVLAHFVAAEISMTRLVEVILAGGPGTPEDFDLNRYNECKVAGMEGASLESLLEQFAAARQASAAMARGLSPEDLQKTGRHPFLGVAPVADILQLMYRHNQIHQRDIRKVMAPA